ncbi:MAG: hypothetical protein WC648_01160 [Candidatus Paceibacterota bacterium]|jgi:hypothetical protein
MKELTPDYLKRMEEVANRINDFIRHPAFGQFINDLYQITGAIEGLTQGAKGSPIIK